MPQHNELYKDRISVSLDGRQIFFLFFGGAVITCMVFVLGVFVGKKVEARGHVDQVKRSSAHDPLAAIDQLEGERLRYQAQLTEGNNATAPVEDQIAEIERVRAKAAKNAATAASQPAKTSPSPAGASEPIATAKSATGDAKAKAAATEGAEPKKPEAVESAKKSERAEPSETAPKPERATVEVVAKKTEPRVEESAKSKTDGDAAQKYTLQLSSFQKRSEAEDFADKVREAGFKARIVEAKVEGRGTFFRVRSGSFTSTEQAETAKREFERKVNKTALVAKM